MADGLLVALWLDTETASTLAVPGGESPDALHITLAYCGDVAELGELAVARAIAAVEREVGWRSALTGKIGGYGRFLASDTSDGKDVAVALPDIPGLTELRQAVVQALHDAGCPPASTHGYTPHITLAYIDPGAADPEGSDPNGPLSFGAVTIMAGDRRMDIPLYAQPAVFAVRHDEARPGHLTVVQPVAAFAEPPEWAPFLPVPGQYAHPIYGALDFSTERYERIVANFKAGVYQDRIPVNAEHDVMSSGAVGWITDMRLADNGAIDARVEWNDRGASLIKGDRYKYVSAEWFDVWTDPVSGEVIPDVATGLALTTHPYFKESVLRPLAASEAVLTRVTAGTTGEEQDMAEDKADVQEPVMEPAVVAEKTTDPVIRQLDEAAAMEFAELRRNAKRLEEENKQLSADRSRLMAESRVKRFTAEVRGASEHNGTAYIGDIQEHVQMLCDLEESFGPNSQQVRFYMEQNRAHAEQMVKSTLFSEMGTGRGAESDTKTYDQIEAQAREIARTSGKSHAQAFNEVLETNPELKSALARERRGGR